MEINERKNGLCECDVELTVGDVATIIRDPKWGEIKGDIYSQEDLQEEFGLYRKSAEQDIIDGVLKEKDEEMQSSIDTHSEQISELQTGLENEVERAINVEQQLSANLTNEINRAKDAEEKLQTNIDNENKRAVAKETSLETGINTEVNRATNAESELRTDVTSLQADNITNKTNIATNAGDIADLFAKNFLQFVKILDSSNITVTDKGKSDEGIQTFSLEVTGQTPSELTSNVAFFNTNPQQWIVSNLILELDEKENSIKLYNYSFANGEVVEKTTEVLLSTDEFKIVDNKLTLAKTYLTTSDASNTYLKKTDAQLTYASKSELMTETTNRIKIDTSLQEQIDAITSRSDVVDVVATKADLEAYDKDITVDDIIKVLQDETQNDATSYYRNTAKAKPYVWELIGVLGPYYTQAQTNSLIEEEKERAGNAESTLTTDLANEVTRATTVEGSLMDKITNEVERAAGAEKTLTDNLTGEITRAKAVEKTLTDNLNSEITRAKAAEEKLTADLSSEVTRAKAEEKTLADNLSTEITRAKNREDEIAEDLSDEIARAKNAEATKVDKVSAANRVYGTDSTGDQITYDSASFGKVDDVTYNSKSIVVNKVASLDGFLTYSDDELS